MRVGIIEIFSRTHIDPVDAKVSCLLHSGHSVVVVALDEVIDFIEYEHCQNESPVSTVRVPFGKLNEALKAMYAESVDVFIFTTVLPSVSALCLTRIPRRYGVIVCVQNAELWFGSFRLGPIKEVLKRAIIAVIKRRVKIYAVGLTETQEYFFGAAGLRDVTLGTTPFSVPRQKKRLTQCNSKNQSVVIPGLYTQDRRDYVGLIDYMLANKSDLNNFKHVSFVFAGAPSSARSGALILSKLTELAAAGYSIKFHHSFIDQREYDSYLEQCCCILSPTQNAPQSREKYGVTKDTGAFWAMYKYQVSGFVPSQISVPEFAGPLTRVYESYDDLFRQLVDLIFLHPKRVDDLPVQEKYIEDALRRHSDDLNSLLRSALNS